jgi:hypothetical protein
LYIRSEASFSRSIPHTPRRTRGGFY